MTTNPTPTAVPSRRPKRFNWWIAVLAALVFTFAAVTMFVVHLRAQRTARPAAAVASPSPAVFAGTDPMTGERLLIAITQRLCGLPDSATTNH